MTKKRDARITDICSHDNIIVTGSPNVIDERQNSSRIGDIYDCPVHGPNPIVTGSPNTIWNGRRVARITDITACRAVIVTGARKCEVNT